MRLFWAALCVVVLTSALFAAPQIRKALRGGAEHFANISAKISAQDAKTPSKFALLVGIDKYKHPDEVPELRSCANDVEDLKKLLVSKFDFPDDGAHIKTLVNSQATHAQIVKEFQDFLIKNAREHPNSVVVFHFSGHGSQVTDVNHDELRNGPNDLEDETLVPYDSRGALGPDAAFDIVDDQIDALYQELSKSTPNSVFIFDSCHSGTVNKGVDADEVREIPKDARPQPAPSPAPTPARLTPEERSIGMLPVGEGYVALSACGAYEKTRGRQHGERLNGTLVFNLIRALRRAGPQTTYRQVMEEVSLSVTDDFPSQHPQLEGAINRPVFGGAANTTAAPVLIEKVEGKEITINQGAADGIKEGLLIAVSAPGGKQLATARVTKVMVDKSVARMEQETPLPKDSKVTLISSNFTMNPVRVSLTQTVGTPPSAGLLAALRLRLSTSNLLAETSDASRWDVSVRRGRYGEAFRNRRGLAYLTRPASGVPDAVPADDADIYYIADKMGNPLLGYLVRASASDAAGSQEIFNSLETFARQRNLRALTNEVSPLNGGLDITVLNVTTQRGPDGRPIVTKEEPLPPQHEYKFDQGQYFAFQIKNRTRATLFIYVFDISNDGKMKLRYSPRLLSRPSEPPRWESLAPNGELHIPTREEGRVMRAVRPAGYNTFKVIASTSLADLSFLEIPGLTLKSLRGDIGPLHLLLSQAYGRERDTGAAPAVDVGVWTTSQVELAVSGATR